MGKDNTDQREVARRHLLRLPLVDLIAKRCRMGEYSDK
jgi:hypothetical protein